MTSDEFLLQDDEVDVIEIIAETEVESVGETEIEGTEIEETEENEGGTDVGEELQNVFERARRSTSQHIKVHKYRVDGKFLCGFCATASLQRLDMMFAQVHTIHEVMSAVTANRLYETEKCENCRIGLMSIFSRKDCPFCQCDACLQLDHKCLKCACDSLEYSMTIRYVKIR